MILYHGTSARYREAIERDGLLPRDETGKSSKWDAKYPSHPDMIYLTNTYAIFYAIAAAEGDENGLIVEVEVDEDYLYPDEDPLAQVTGKEDYDGLADMSLEQRTDYFRENMYEFQHLYPESLRLLGTCCHAGGIAVDEIKRIVEFPIMGDLVMAHDPCISVMNYKFRGEYYINQLQRFMDSGGDYKSLFTPEELDRRADMQKIIEKQIAEDLLKSIGG